MCRTLCFFLSVLEVSDLDRDTVELRSLVPDPDPALAARAGMKPERTSIGREHPVIRFELYSLGESSAKHRQPRLAILRMEVRRPETGLEVLLSLKAQNPRRLSADEGELELLVHCPADGVADPLNQLP